MQPHETDNMPENNCLDFEDLSRRLSTGSPHDGVPALWGLARLRRSRSLGYRDESDVANALRYECVRLRSLITENTLIKEEPFRKFAEQLAVTLQDYAAFELRQSTYSDRIQQLFADYRRNANNFLGLAAAARVVRGDWGSFVGCRAGEDEFFTLASGDVRRDLIHFDCWMDEADIRHELASRYVGALEKITGRESGIVLVNKELGPVGPLMLWSEISDGMSHQLPVYHYDQASKSTVKNGDTSPKHFVVLYDLLNSGEGIREIQDRIGAQFPDARFDFLILYDYNENDSKRDELGSVIPVFDRASFPALSPGRLYDTLGQGRPLESCMASPFARARLKHVDPLYDRRTTLAEDSSWIDTDPELRRSYSGKWVAVEDVTVLASADSAEDLCTIVERNHSNRAPVIRFVDPAANEVPVVYC